MNQNMKWKISSLLTVFALVVAIFVIPVRAGTTAETSLTEDSSEVFTVKSNESGTLNLNGFTQSEKIVIEKGGTLSIVGPGKVSVTGDHAIINNGTLTITGEVIVDALSHGKAAIYNEFEATTTINGGTFLRSNEAGYKDDAGKGYDGGNSWYTILNHGTMQINGGTFENKGNYASMIDNGWATGGPTGGVTSKLTITGGTFTSGMHAIKNDSYGELNISGGNIITTGSGSAVLNWHKGTITGGTFTAQKNCAIYALKDRAGIEDGILSISGGTFNSIVGKASIVTDSLGEVTVTGGTYNGSIGVALGATYKIVVENGRNVVKVKVPAITLSESKTAVAVGTTKALTATRVDAINGDIVWTSANTSVATVTNGVIKTVKPGVANITATADGVSATCEVQVYKTEKPTLPTPPVNNGKDTTIEVNEKTVEVLSNSLNEIVKNVDTAMGISETTKTALKDAIAQGKQISVEAKTEKVDAKKVDKKEVAKIEKVIAKDAKIAQYFDLSMMIQADGTDLGTMNELNSKASFTITVPKDLAKEGRTFYMVRIHNGVAEKMAGTLKGNDFTFESDKFSLYALVYEDAKTVDTGDMTNTTSLLMMMGAASLIFGGLLIRKRFEK